MLYKNKQLLEDFGVTAAIGASALATGVLTGIAFQKMINKLKNKYTSCRAIEDPYTRDRCVVGILNSMIEHMKNVSNRECDSTPDPAQCRYDMLLKIEKLIDKKRRLETHLYRQDRAEIIDKRKS